jgi:general secretion pathway protein J
VKGFTLVEMMVALLIFGLVAAAGVSVMGFSVDARQAVQSRTDALGAFQRARALLTADLQQAADRRTRDEVGGGARPAFSGGGEGALLSFVRRGWDNPDAAPRASLQYVEYRLEGDRLLRRAGQSLDGSVMGPPQELFSDVRKAEVQFLKDGQWIAAWRSSPSAAFPDAVRLDLDLAGLGEVRQLFLLPGGAE